MLIMGQSVDAIGERLCISVNTVRTHNKNLYKKLGVHAKSDLLTLVATFEEQP